MIDKINIGAAPNDGTGDPLRTACGKVNTNYDWLTNKIGTDDQAVTLSGNIGKRFIDMTASTEVYDDLVFNINTLNPVGIGSAAAIVSDSGPSGTQEAIRYTTNNTLYVTVQMAHTWVAGTTVYPHIHVSPQTALANTIVWRGFYSVSDIGGTFPLDTATGNFNGDIPAGSQYKHLLIPLPPAGISMAGKTGPSTIIRMKFEVVSSSATFDVIGFDVHYRWGGTPVIYSP